MDLLFHMIHIQSSGKKGLFYAMKIYETEKVATFQISKLIIKLLHA